MGRCVADSPIRCGRASAARSRRSSVRVRWEPRLSRAAEWISSTMTVSTVRRTARLRAAVTIRYSDSGVVMRKFGGRRTMRARSLLLVSPVRTATVSSGAG
jgi:hypothetical protein